MTQIGFLYKQHNNIFEGCSILKKIAATLDLIKFPHTIFSLPFAIISAFLAAEGLPSIKQLVIILIALVTARSCAMAFNRLVDAKYDECNPRTTYRISHLKFIGRGYVWLFAIVCAGIFILSSAMLNRLSLYMSPFALLILLGYSYTKRFTHASHFILGLALALAPIGAWIGINGEFGLPAFILGIAVLFWTSGFDLIYSCQDVTHDKRMGLFSFPKRFGIKAALRLSLILHIITIVLLVILIRYTTFSFIYLSGVGIVTGLLFYEHSLVKPDDLSKVNLAFFDINGIISIGLMAMSLIDIFVLG